MTSSAWWLPEPGYSYMQMIYGSITDTRTPQVSEIEKRHILRMMSALDPYPWKSAAALGITGGALGIHSADEVPASVQVWDGLMLAADVRLDNRPELCALLGIPVAEEAGFTDKGIILRAYRRWGTDCAAHLLGDFAFALWDEKMCRLFCARDVVGVQPFYYYHTPGRFIFASDLMALTAHPDAPMQLNLHYVKADLQTVRGQFLHPEHTYYLHIEKLLPAHCLTLDGDGLKFWAYWQPGEITERRYADEREYAQELGSLLQAAVACRVKNKRRVGSHLSGGLDSSSVAVLAHRILRNEDRQMVGFSWAPPLQDDRIDRLTNDERKLVEDVRLAEGMQVCYTRLQPAHVLAYARRDYTLQPTTTLQFELAASEEAARLDINTILSGWGGDELVAFNGRGYFSDLLRRGHWSTLQREISLRTRLHGGSIWRQWIVDGFIPLFPPVVLGRLDRYNSQKSRNLPACMRPGFANLLTGITPLTRPPVFERPGVHRMQIALLQNGHLSYRMESWASHGATLGITYAFPLLDRRLVEFALSIPDYLFFKNGWKRYLYRTAMAGILPDSLRWNKKKEDQAMNWSHRNAYRAADQELREQLLARAGNPFVDVGQLQSLLDIERDARNVIQDGHLTQSELRRLYQTARTGRIRWLAFVNDRATVR